MIGRKNYYQVLMVDQAADADILAVVHRRLAQRFHPDLDPGDEARQKMLEINQAYDVLRNPERRAKYDQELVARRDRRTSDRYLKRPTDPGPVGAAASSSIDQLYGEAGPPPRGVARGTILDFGRYKGWSLGQIAAHDPDFLEWLERSPGGRQHRAEIATLLKR
ncbi:MAG: DnaJ domain-containing protein [Chloroflexi bacterium]|nr:DnaJ domain-containing protein [Chloroflexota bacterium]